jgi:hypothetical protein
MGSLAGSLAMLVSGILLVSGTRLGYSEAKIKRTTNRSRSFGLICEDV